MDVKAGFIRLRPEDTKTREGHSIPLNPILTKMLQEIKVRHLKSFVFTHHGEPVNDFKIVRGRGHKALVVFKWYNMVDEDELKSLAMDTSMETKEGCQEQHSANYLK